MNILLIEDDPDDARLIRELFSAEPHLHVEIVGVDRLSAARQVLSQARFDAVLLDLSLPDSRGIEAVSQIHAASPDVPIVVLTDLDDESLALRAVELGAQDYLVKGRADGPVLVRAIGYAIQRCQAERVARQLLREQAARVVAQAGERRFRALAEAIPQIVWEVDAAGAELYLSPRWYEYTGHRPEEQRENRWRDAIHPDDYDACTEGWSRAMAGSTVWEMQYRLRRADGTYHWHLGRAVPSFDPDGRVGRWYGTATDIDAQTRADELREQFVAIVGHDLRNPLMSVALGADLLLDGTDPVTPKQATVLRRIAKSTSRMTRLIGQLMDFARARAGVALPVDRADTSLNDLCRRVAEECALGGEREIRVEAEEQIHGQWDADRLEEAASNLIGNAVQHGDRTPITLRIDRRGSDAVVSVHNLGDPIPPEVLPHIFDPFRRGPSKKKSSSIGLGLFITQQIVLAHGGGITVRSSAADGTTFTVTLPIEPPDPADAAGGEDP